MIMQKENLRIGISNNSNFEFDYFNHLVWFLGLALFIWIAIGGERGGIDAAVILAVIYLLRE